MIVDTYTLGATQIMSTRTLEADLFGRETRFEYSDHWVGYALLGLRFVMAWVFLQAGIAKLLEPDWTAAGFLANAVPAGNPFGGLWVSLAGSPMVDMLVVWGQLLIGLTLLVGAFVRLAAFFGAFQMILFWAAHLEGGLMAGLPVGHGFFVSSHIVDAILLFGLGAIGAGRILGVDAWPEEQSFVRSNRWLRVFLG
jgi:thiosulfate dehydrogenase [quinone] large subunit